MKYQGFRYDFSPKELKVFLFGRRCPDCDSKLKRNKTFEMKKGRDFDSKYDYFPADNATIKYYTFQYECPNCKRVYSIKELTNI